MSVRYLHTADAPAAIGPYSQATVVGGFLFTAGQIALDPEDRRRSWTATPPRRPSR